MLNIVKSFYLKKFKEAYTHKGRKSKEEMERVHERNFQNSRIDNELIMLVHSLKNENELVAKISLL